MRWEAPQRVSGHLLPHRVSMKVAKADLDVQIRYRDVGLNDPLGDDAFRVACPPGTRVEEIHCPGEEVTPAALEQEGDS